MFQKAAMHAGSECTEQEQTALRRFFFELSPPAAPAALRLPGQLQYDGMCKLQALQDSLETRWNNVGVGGGSAKVSCIPRHPRCLNGLAGPATGPIQGGGGGASIDDTCNRTA
jgi:hypothetical protein